MLLGKGCVIHMSKIAVMGERDSIMGFAALGISTFPVEGSDEAKTTLHKLAREEEDFTIIYVTEQCAEGIMQEIDKYKDHVTPAVILIPGRDGALGLGQKALKDASLRAIGTELI